MAAARATGVSTVRRAISLAAACGLATALDSKGRKQLRHFLASTFGARRFRLVKTTMQVLEYLTAFTTTVFIYGHLCLLS